MAMSVDFQKLWDYCNVLRDEGLSYQDYLEQLTFVLFLKMADEQAKRPLNRQLIIPHGLGWESLAAAGWGQPGGAVPAHPDRAWQVPRDARGIFQNARNKIQDPVKLHRPCDRPDRPVAMDGAGLRR